MLCFCCLLPASVSVWLDLFLAAWKLLSYKCLLKLLLLLQLPSTTIWGPWIRYPQYEDRRICCLTNLGTTPLVSSEAVMERERCPFSLGNIILLKEKRGMRESFPKQVDKESRGPQGERSLEFSRRKKGQTFFLSPHSLGLYNNNVSWLRPVSGLNLLLS